MENKKKQIDDIKSAAEAKFIITIIISIALGVGVGAATNRVPLWTVIGVVLGIGLGVWLKSTELKKLENLKNTGDSEKN